MKINSIHSHLGGHEFILIKEFLEACFGVNLRNQWVFLEFGSDTSQLAAG